LSQIFEHWNLSDRDQISLLSMDNSIKARHLYLYRRGDKSFDFNETSFKRAQIIIGIFEALSTTYPTNAEYASIWLKRPVRKFKHKAPLELMLSGEVGMNRVWNFLDCTQSWSN
jgi:uncharacterized protein (DUF2384 family)